MRVKRKSWLWNLVPFAGRHRFASTIGSTTFLPPKKYKASQSETPPQHIKDLLRHECVHVCQWQEEGLRYVLEYLFSRKWRLRYEIEAYAEQCRLDPNRKRIERYARWLSSWRYGWLGSRPQIVRAIRKALDSANSHRPA